MSDYEKLGLFYLGRAIDTASKAAKPGYLLYDSTDLVTHAVCVGMTGSGKTGVCIDLLEEAAIDRIPSIVIDPKGDLGDLLLTFPNLAASDFRPWIDEDEARRNGKSPDDWAAAQADLWKTGPGEVGPGRSAYRAPEGRGRVRHLHAGIRRGTAAVDREVVRGAAG